MRRLVCSFAAVAAASGAAVANPVPTTDTTVADLTDTVTRLQAEVESLRAAQGDNWLTERRADEIRSLVQDVLADADTRSSLLQSGMTAGWDGHPFIASADGNFRLELQGQVQVRFVYNNQDDDSSSDSDRWGFENRRTKIKFAGHVVDPTWKYKVTGAFKDSGGAFTLEDSYIEKKLGNGWSVRIGQFKAPFMREELVSSSKQLLVDRSLVNERFNQDFSQGVQLDYKAEQFNFAFMLHDGFGSDNVPWSTEDTEFAGTARVEFLAAGEWKQFKDFTSKQGSETAVLLGAAVHYEKDEYGTGSGPEVEDWRFTLDGSVEGDGWNVFAAFVYQDLDSDGGTNVSPWGFVIQGGLYVNEKNELFLRYEYGDSDADSAEDLSVITVGLNHYFNKNVKWTTDVGFGLDEVDGAWDKTGVGWREDGTDEDGQFVFRTQLQLLF
jgi:hypothetical protein